MSTVLCIEGNGSVTTSVPGWDYVNGRLVRSEYSIVLCGAKEAAECIRQFNELEPDVEVVTRGSKAITYAGTWCCERGEAQNRQICDQCLMTLTQNQ